MKTVIRLLIPAWPLLVAGSLAAFGCQPPEPCTEGVCGPDCNAAMCVPTQASAVETPAKEVVIETPVLERLISSGVRVAILDARTGKFDDGMRIPGARSLSPEAAVQEVQKVISSKDELVVTYCANLKCPASRNLAKHLSELGYRNVLEYTAGIAGWKEAGHEVVKAE